MSTENLQHRGTGDVNWTPLFGLVAPSLGWSPPLRYLLRRARVLRLLKGLPRGRVLEVGCGAGALLDDLSRLGFSATGVETSPRAFAIAEKLAALGGGTQHVVDSPAPDWVASHDLVCAFDVLEHIEKDSAAIGEWISWLRPGGQLMLSVPAHRGRWNPGDEWAGHWRRYDRQDLYELLAKHGLGISHFECYGFPLANLTERFGSRVYRRLIAQRASGTTREEASTESGIERTAASRLFRSVDTLPGRFALKSCMVLQAVTSGVDWGGGFLVLAHKS